MLNLNIGILGHVDSGKTTMAKALSEIASTAAFDKNPQSKERGITLDLGFSALEISDVPEHLKDKCTKLQYTFVDCPGHSSLIRTVIGGVQIIDLMILVIDVNKGIQTQTAECLVIAEIVAKKIIIALNKIDLLDENKRDQLIQKVTKRIKTTLSNTIFSNSQIVPVSALNKEKLADFIEILKNESYFPTRDLSSPFLCAIDHCFAIKGQGTVCTGTILSGSVKVNDEIEIPKLKLSKKVKSMQIFRQKIEMAGQGDRVGICIAQFDPSQMERGLLCSPKLVRDVYAVVMKLNPIKYFKGVIKSKSKIHIICGYETTMAQILLFRSNQSEDEFIIDREYEYVPELCYETMNINDKIFVLLEFEKTILAVTNSLVIATKFDIQANDVCRLAFWGRLETIYYDKNYVSSILPNLKIYKEKSRSGNIQRIANEYELISDNLFKKSGSNRQKFIGLKINLTTGQKGLIQDTFGQTSKVKLRMMEPLDQEIINRITKQKDVKIELKFKKFIFCSKNANIVQ